MKVITQSGTDIDISEITPLGKHKNENDILDIVRIRNTWSTTTVTQYADGSVHVVTIADGPARHFVKFNSGDPVRNAETKATSHSLFVERVTPNL